MNAQASGSVLLRLFVVLSLLLGGAGVLAAPASAHAELVGSDPADGSTLPAAPEQVSLEFTDELNADLVVVTLTGTDGAQLELAAPEVEGATITQAVPPVRGAATVAYRVVSADGHPVQGTVAFRVDAPAPTTTAAPTTSAAAAPTTSAAAAPTTSAAAPATSAEVANAAARVDGDGGVPTWAVLLGIGAVVVGGVVLARRLVRA